MVLVLSGFWPNVFASAVAILAMIAIFGVLFGVKNYGTMKKRREHFQALHQDLKPGKKVEFSNGLRGTVKRVGEETVDIEVKSGVVIEVSRYAISKIVGE